MRFIPNKNSHLQRFEWLPPCNRGGGYNLDLSPIQESRVRFYGAYAEIKETCRARRASQRGMGQALEFSAAPGDGHGVWTALEQSYDQRRERPVLVPHRS